MHFDCIIIGGGLVGITAALSLAKLGLQIALLDKNPEAVSKHHLDDASKDNSDLVKQRHDIDCASFDAFEQANALALTKPSIEFLESQNVVIAALDPACIETIEVSSHKNFGISHIAAQDITQDAHSNYLAKVVNARKLQSLLDQTIGDHPGVKVIRPCHILDIEQTMQNSKLIWKIITTSGEFTAHLILGADGQNSWFRNFLGIETQSKNLDQVALSCNIQIEGQDLNKAPSKLKKATTIPGLNLDKNDVHKTAFKRFTQDGSLALLPLQNNIWKCVWIMRTEKSLSLKAMPQETLVKELQTLWGLSLGKFQRSSKPSFTPLYSITAEHIYGQGFVLLGNAAKTLSPTTAQGLNLALRDIATFIKILQSALSALKTKENKNIFSLELLKKYAEKRMKDHTQTQRFTDILSSHNNLFSLGILATELFPVLKKRILKFGFGLV